MKICLSLALSFVFAASLVAPLQQGVYGERTAVPRAFECGVPVAVTLYELAEILASLGADAQSGRLSSDASATMQELEGFFANCSGIFYFYIWENNDPIVYEAMGAGSDAVAPRNWVNGSTSTAASAGCCSVMWLVLNNASAPVLVTMHARLYRGPNNRIASHSSPQANLAGRGIRVLEISALPLIYQSGTLLVVEGSRQFPLRTVWHPGGQPVR